MSSMAILCIGDELLDGRVEDENARHLIDLSRRSGVALREVRFVADDLEAIVAALRSLTAVDLVVVSGGLGPTADDITRDAAAVLSDSPLVEDEELAATLKAAFEARGFVFTENNRRQCQFPERARVLATEVGTAAGFQLREEGTEFYFFPGVPREFRWFVERYLPQFSVADEKYRKRMIFFGLGESQVETKLAAATAEAERRSVRIGYRADRSLIEVILKGEREDCDAVEAMVRKRIGPYLVAEDEERAVERLKRRLLEAKATVSVAESCTAGLLGARLTEVSGSSAYFREGYLTYANEAKMSLVHVDGAMLQEYGAVSPQVVCQMALGAQKRSGATFALAVSGIAGPTGGSPEKPVGTVDFALATPEGVYYRRASFTGRSREQVRLLSVHLACAMLLWRLEERLLEHPVQGPYSAELVRDGAIET